MFNIKVWRPVGSNTCEGVRRLWNHGAGDVAKWLVS